MSKQIKLIWDFRGPTASRTAAHHEQHLIEFIRSEMLQLEITGCTDYSSMHSAAFLVVREEELTKVRDALKPHRGEIYAESHP